MQELINSMMRFSAAMTMFSLEQMQNMLSAVTDQASLKRVRESLDAVSKAVTAEMDETNRQAVDSMSKLGADVVDRTMDVMNVRALDPREIIDTTGHLVRRTVDSVADLMKKPAAAAETPSSGEPVRAAEALGGGK